MMKKPLFSIMTMVILTSSTAYAAHSVQKDIVVEAEISESLIITMDKADGSPFNSLELTLDPSYGGAGYIPQANSDSLGPNPGYLVAIQPVKITAPQDTKVEISFAEEFVMHHVKGEDKQLYPDVYIDGEELFLSGEHEVIFKNKVRDITLEVVVQDSHTKPGDKYTGVLKLVMESVP